MPGASSLPQFSFREEDLLAQLFGLPRSARARESEADEETPSAKRRRPSNDAERIDCWIAKQTETYVDGASVKQAGAKELRRLADAAKIDVKGRGLVELEEIRTAVLNRQEEQCLMCLDPFKKGDVVVRLRCGHIGGHVRCAKDAAYSDYERGGGRMPSCSLCRTAMF